MNLEVFERFKEESETMISTSIWLTKEMDKLNEEAEYYLDHPPDERAEEIYKQMKALEKRAQWEDKELIKFAKKYERFLKSDM